MRPVHLIIVDSWHPEALAQEWDSLPTLRCMADYGRLQSNCVSIFPTVTPAALTSLATGVGAREHGIQGILWYSRREDRYIHYWPQPDTIWKGSLRVVARDVTNLSSHLRAPTLFQLLEEAGIPSASVNFPISSAPFLHRADLGWLVPLVTGLPRHLALRGPRWMTYGTFLRPNGCSRWAHKWGITDQTSAAYTRALIREHRPPFMLTYFPEHDLRSHHHGPMKVGFSLHKIDASLRYILESYGSVDRALEEARWIVVGDHSQSSIGGFPNYSINMFEALKGYRVAPLAEGGLESGKYDLAVAPNDRGCLVYLPKGDRRLLLSLRHLFSRWESVDLLFWREGDFTYAQSSAGQCRWRRGGGLWDEYRQSWEVDGDLTVVSVTTEGDRIRYHAYPDLFHRVDDLLGGPQAPDLALNARPGYEFSTGFTMGKGNHGSLSREDSLVPLLSCGIETPEHPRVTDLVEVVLKELGVPWPEHLKRRALR